MVTTGLYSYGDGIIIIQHKCADYTQRLQADGVEIELYEVDIGFHGIMAMGSAEESIVKDWKRFHTFGMKFLYI